MMLSARTIDGYKHERLGAETSKQVSFFRFLLRYPILLFAFGPPIFRIPSDKVDATKGILDIWSFIQFGLLAMIAFRAIWHITTMKSIFIPKQIRTILILAFILNVLFLSSATYSPSRSVSAAYAILYFLTLICVFEFILDIYRNFPNIMRFLFHLRLTAMLLFILDLVILPFKPDYLMVEIPDVGIRFSGGTIGPVGLICSMMAIVSAYTFLHSLESRVRAAVFFFAGFIGAFSTQSRGGEIALLISLAVLGYFWATAGRYTAYLFVSLFSILLLLFSMLLGSVGVERLWGIFNRGGDTRSFENASGRTEAWKYIIQYCMSHPWGMGYITGFRILFRSYSSFESGQTLSHMGNAHSTYMQVLSDAGWFALAIYLIMLVKIVRLALRFTNKQTYMKITPYNSYRVTIECTLVMLTYMLVVGISSADYVIPLRIYFYWQFILIAIILGASARVIAASRVTHISKAL